MKPFSVAFQIPSFFMKSFLIVVFLLVVFPGAWRQTVHAQSPGNIFSLQFENDFFGGGTDRHFTHGSRLFFMTKPIDWITDAADKLPWFSKALAMTDPDNVLQARSSLSIGQNIYTPEDISNPELIDEDRPYAGWLYFAMGIVANQGSNRFDQVELNIGMVGPSSRAEEVQTHWHDFFALTEPKGWHNQLNDELGVVLVYEQARRIAPKYFLGSLQYDIIPHFGGNVGNVFTFGKAGITMRLGMDLTKDFGPPRIRPSLPGGGFFKKSSGFNFYLFAGAEARLVFYNVFLDGNTFEDSHSVDKNPVVGDIQAGIVLQYNRFRFSYTQIFRTKEFKGQQTADKFGSLSLSYQF